MEARDTAVKKVRWAESTGKGVRLTAEEEQALAQAAQEAEAVALDAIMDIDVATHILGRIPKREERTRAGAVNRLEEAIEAVWACSRDNASIRTQARQAKQAWAEAENYRWCLAMSGRRIAYGEARKLTGPYMSEEDLAQEGFIGLLRAAKRFEPDRGIRFSTYARWWVRAQMTRAIDHTGRPVRLPGCAVEQTRNLRKAMSRFESSGMPYGVQDLAAEIGVEVSRVELLMSQGKVVSLDQPSDGGKSGRQWESILPDEEAVGPDQMAVLTQELGRMRAAMSVLLTERQQYVLQRRYGLVDGHFRTLSAIGRELSLSRERVRQIERDALERLRSRSNIREAS
jgi:RNA polymerase nonessential primary-like sigma factor